MTEIFGNAGLSIPPGSITPDKLGFTAARLSAYRVAGWTVPSTFTNVVFDSVDPPGFRIDANEYDTSTGAFVPVDAGYYFIQSCISIANGQGKFLIIRITKDEVNISAGIAYGSATLTTVVSVSAIALVYLTPSNTIRIKSQANTPTTGGASDITNLKIFRVL